MNDYIVRQITPDDYKTIRKLVRDSFEYNERGSDGYWHAVFGDNIRRSPHYIPELELVAVTDDGVYLGHAIFSTLPMGDDGKHIIWLNNLAVKHGEKDNHTDKSYEYQRKGIGTALVMRGIEIAKSLLSENLSPWITPLLVHPDERGNRYGKMLLDYARKEAGRLGFKLVYLTTGEIRFYEKYGFREVGLTTFTWGRPTKVYEHDAIFNNMEDL